MEGPYSRPSACGQLKPPGAGYTALSVGHHGSSHGLDSEKKVPTIVRESRENVNHSKTVFCVTKWCHFDDKAPSVTMPKNRATRKIGPPVPLIYS